VHMSDVHFTSSDIYGANTFLCTYWVRFSCFYDFYLFPYFYFVYDYVIKHNYRLPAVFVNCRICQKIEYLVESDSEERKNVVGCGVNWDQ